MKTYMWGNENTSPVSKIFNTFLVKNKHSCVMNVFSSSSGKAFSPKNQLEKTAALPDPSPVSGCDFTSFHGLLRFRSVRRSLAVAERLPGVPRRLELLAGQKTDTPGNV